VTSVRERTPVNDAVGPVLQAGPLCEAVIAVICERHPDAVVIDRGAYKRVLVPVRCSLARSAIEQHLGQPFYLPGDLEAIMTSFVGKFRVSEEEACWHVPGEEPA
jgi:hypothetical protein